MRIVIDTNMLLATLPKASRYRIIINYLVSGKLEIAVSTSILLEYQEVITNKTNEIVAYNFLEFISKQPNVIFLEPPYNWQLIEADKDDNKFSDCAVACGADYLVTNDHHFNILQQIPFPPINIIKAEDFLMLLTSL